MNSREVPLSTDFEDAPDAPFASDGDVETGARPRIAGGGSTRNAVAPPEADREVESRDVASARPARRTARDRRPLIPFGMKSPERASSKSNRSSSVRIFDRFLCGSSLVEALRMAGAAGHHCDEDHVGLYVANTESEGSSIATAQGMNVKG